MSVTLLAAFQNYENMFRYFIGNLILKTKNGDRSLDGIVIYKGSLIRIDIWKANYQRLPDMLLDEFHISYYFCKEIKSLYNNEYYETF